jgi:hypothetical protein
MSEEDKKKKNYQLKYLISLQNNHMINGFFFGVFNMEFFLVFLGIYLCLIITVLSNLVFPFNG